MKTTIKVTYTEMVTPPRCRKARPQNGKTEITVNIRELSDQQAPIAFVVSEYDREPRKVRQYKGKLYRQVQDMQPQYLKTNKRDESRPFWLNRTADTFSVHPYTCGRYNADFKEYVYPTLAEQKATARKYAENHIIVDGEVYERTGEPYYYVTCFGLGCNHGGTGFFVGWADYRERKAVWGWMAEDKAKAINGAVEIALNRGDIESEDHIRNTSYNIQVLMPEAIKRRYARI